jgi:hypothetical protein
LDRIFPDLLTPGIAIRQPSHALRDCCRLLIGDPACPRMAASQALCDDWRPRRDKLCSHLVGTAAAGSWCYQRRCGLTDGPGAQFPGDRIQRRGGNLLPGVVHRQGSQNIQREEGWATQAAEQSPTTTIRDAQAAVHKDQGR